MIAQKIAEKVTGESEDCLITSTDKIKRRKSDEYSLGSLADEAQAPICYSPNAPKDLNKKQVGIASEEEIVRAFEQSPDQSVAESIKDKQSGLEESSNNSEYSVSSKRSKSAKNPIDRKAKKQARLEAFK